MRPFIYPWDADGMYKKNNIKDAYDFSEEEYRKLVQQPGAHEVVIAVRQYNQLVTQSKHYEENETNALLKKEAEEEAKIFLDGILDLAEKRTG